MIAWDQIYAMVSSAIGVSWEYLDEYMTLPRLYAYFKHWEEYPPVHITLASIVMGFAGKTPGASGPKSKTPEDLDRVMADFGAAGFEMQGTSKTAGPAPDTSVSKMINDLVRAGCKPEGM